MSRSLLGPRFALPVLLTVLGGLLLAGCSEEAGTGTFDDRDVVFRKDIIPDVLPCLADPDNCTREALDCLQDPDECKRRLYECLENPKECEDDDAGDGVLKKLVDGTVGGVVEFNDVTLDFPKNAVEGEEWVLITQPDPDVLVFDFATTAEGHFGAPVRLTVNYGRHGGASEHCLILWYDESTGLWVDMGAENDPVTGTVRVDLWHFSRYAVVEGTAGWE